MLGSLIIGLFSILGLSIPTPKTYKSGLCLELIHISSNCTMSPYLDATKSTLFNKDIKPKYFGSLAIRGITKKENLKFLNENNIAIFLGPNIHLVAYPVNIENQFNLVVITRNKLDQNNFNKNHIKMYEIVATSAFRDTQNSEDARRYVENKIEHPIRIISGLIDIALAMQSLCCCPPDKDVPGS